MSDDWVTKAARIIHLQFDLKAHAPQDTSIPRLAGIIREHCPVSERCHETWAGVNRCVRPLGHEESHLTEGGFDWVEGSVSDEDRRCAAEETGRHTLRRRCRLDAGHVGDHRFGRKN